MVFNAAAKSLLSRAGVVDVVSHDWWTYLMVSGAGGQVIYDPVPCLSYRQHGDNAIGDNRGLRARIKRYAGFVQGKNREWYSRNLSALMANREFMTPQNTSMLEHFAGLRGRGMLERLRHLSKSGVYAQTRIGQLGLYIATLLKKI